MPSGQDDIYICILSENSHDNDEHLNAILSLYSYKDNKAASYIFSVQIKALIQMTQPAEAICIY